MKIAAITLLVILVLLPFGIRVTLIIARLLKHGDSTAQSPNKIINPSKIKLYRKLAYVYVSSYVLIIFIAGFWVLSEFFHANNLSSKAIVYSGVFTFILFSVEGVMIFLQLRYMNKINPRPKLGSDNKAILEWENKNSDLMMKNLGRFLLVLIGCYLILIALFILIIYLTR